MKGHNRKCPCRMCNIHGILKPGATTYYVPLQAPVDLEEVEREPRDFNPHELPLRNHDTFLEQAHHVEAASSAAEAERRAKECGINGVPILSHPSSLFFPHSFPFDFMHLVYENLIKNLLDFWSGNFKDLSHEGEGYRIEKSVWDAICEATYADGKTTPGAYGPRIPDFSKDRRGLTADMLSFWTLYLGPIYLNKSFPNDEYYDHFILLVRLVTLCLQFEIDRSDVDVIRAGFIEFVEGYERYVS
jgi:hypothetical protein